FVSSVTAMHAQLTTVTRELAKAALGAGLVANCDPALTAAREGPTVAELLELLCAGCCATDHLAELVQLTPLAAQVCPRIQALHKDCYPCRVRVGDTPVRECHCIG